MIGEQSAQTDVRTPDGKRLAVEVTGAPDGSPVFLLHGTPGSRSGIKPRGILLYRQGVRLICYDRPGYGRSERREGRRVVDAAADVEAIADALEIDRFAVVGRSGGGPHALAVAAMLPQRVTRAAVLVSIAPADAAGLDWYRGMSASNVDEYQAADTDRGSLMASLTSQADRMRRDPESLVAFLDKELSDPDRRVIGNVAMRRKITDSYAEAVRYGAEGWIDDALAFRRNWGFEPSSIRVPVRLWHGADDQFSPVSHTHWLAAQIRGAEIEVAQGAGHFAAVEILPRMLTWLTETGVVAADKPAATVQPIRTGAGRAPGTPVVLRAAR
ncbi:alpha/beta hydrolase [Phytohabitans rumicis]|uniref:alpha/beta fold hydrolase n=1 Tax=Phytohabitans rumicis TaxID=1076125 RepID=UPI0031EEBE4A